MRPPKEKVIKKHIVCVILFTLLTFVLSNSTIAAPINDIVEVSVSLELKQLPLDKQEKMSDFREKLLKYLNDYSWLEDGDEEDMYPFKLHFQVFLEDRPSNIEDRYRCSIVASGPDNQYIDTRATFAFQEGEPLEHDGQVTSLKQLLDFYVYLLIAAEFDKLGHLEGAPYFAKARAALEQGKFVRFPNGWDRRDELMEQLEGANYKKYREMVDYYFYALSIWPDEKGKARENMAKAIFMLREIKSADVNLEAPKHFINAHYQEVIELFKNASNREPIEILKELDPDREDIYDEYL